MRISYLFFLVLAALVGCGIPLSQSAMERTPEASYLKKTVERLAAHDLASVQAALDPEIQEPNISAALERTAAVFPSGQPTSIEFVGWIVGKSSNGGRFANLSAQYGYEGKKWLLVYTQLRGDPENFRIFSLQVEPLPKPLSEINAFTLSGKGILHYLFLGAATLTFVITIYAFVQCWRTPGLKRRWLWALFTLVGICALSLNWTAGRVNFNPLSFNLFCAATTRDGFAGPWIVTFYFPIGALVFLSKRRGILSAINVQGQRIDHSDVGSDVSNVAPPEST